LLTKKYNGDSHKVDLKVKDVVTFNPIFTRNAAGLVTGTAAVEGSYEAFSWCLLKLKYTISTAGNLKTNVTAEKVAPGLIFEGNWDAALGDSVSKDTYDLTAKYNTKNVNIETKVAKSKSTIAEMNFVWAALTDLSIGGMMNFNLINKTQETIAAGAQYSCSPKTRILTVFQRDILADGVRDTLKAGFVTKGSPFLFGAEYTTTLADPKKGVITAGCETTLEGGQIVKAKVDTKGGMALSLQQSLSKQFKFCSSLEFGATKDAAWASKFGTELIYEA